MIGVWKCFKASRFLNQKKNFFRFLMLFNNSFSRLGVGLGRKDVFFKRTQSEYSRNGEVKTNQLSKLASFIKSQREMVFDLNGVGAN